VRAAALLWAVCLMSGCVTSPPRLVNQEDAQVEFAKLGPGGKRLAETFYDLGAGDSIKRLYWAQRQSQQASGTPENSAPSLQRRYVNIPYAPFRDADGTLHEGGVRAVEIVQWFSVKLKNGKRFNLCH
jgi:hypothetical protein